MITNIFWLNVKAKIFAHMPESVKYSVNTARILPRYLSWRFHPDGWQHAQKVLLPYKDRYSGYRCIVIGNGPSLKKMNLAVLRNEFTFGLNRIYLLFDEWGFSTTFLVSVNRLVLQQFGDELQNVNALVKVFSWGGRQYIQSDAHTAFLAAKPSKVMTGQISAGYYPTHGTVTNIALELAYFMGFSEVLLIGVDHNFTDRGTGGKAIIANGPDQNHFSNDYFGKGTVWQLPNYESMEYGYRKAYSLYQRGNRRIVDATPGGKLQIFPKVDFMEYLNASNFPNRARFDAMGMPDSH